MSLCKVNGLFRLTRDAEMVNTQSGVTITKLGLACSEKYKDKETQLFLDAVVFGKMGEIISQYAGTKGTQLFLSGKLQTETWETEGQKRSKVSMTIEGFDFVSSGQQSQPKQQYNANTVPTEHQQVLSNSIPSIDVDEDEIPF